MGRPFFRAGPRARGPHFCCRARRARSYLASLMLMWYIDFFVSLKFPSLLSFFLFIFFASFFFVSFLTCFFYSPFFFSFILSLSFFTRIINFLQQLCEDELMLNTGTSTLICHSACMLISLFPSPPSPTNQVFQTSNQNPKLSPSGQVSQNTFYV